MTALGAINSQTDLTPRDGRGLRTVSTTPVTLSPTDDFVITDATAGSLTITLPAASAKKDPIEFARKDAVTLNTVTIQRAGSDTIAGLTSLALAAQFSSVTLQSDGVSSWYKLSVL